ncbi:hypothetical protein J2S49_001588 [Arcanobacterium wilhelmae]|uniref:Uncharacterized protein n=1 Tax=Arcanobacterium wilhelmae TaxID=1803177 RepID=A0ABT9NCZ0_9ACTO|nr:hypothetical protein [Arcanobacterium wilhelmae]MDP9801512.1 hypothetical protein [Arcanobacterium wilhelmae]
MNITELNKAIAALNQIAEIATSAAGVLEQAGWESFEDHHGMSGVRPIAAAELSHAALDDAYQDQIEQSTTADPVVTVEEVRAALADLSKAGLTAQARSLIEQTGVSKLSEVDPGKFAWLLEQAKVITDATE